MACHGGRVLSVEKEWQMEMNVEQLVKMSESWLPVVLQYSGQLTLAVITLLVGWWLINTLTHKVGAVLDHRNVDRALHSFIGSLASIVLKVLLLVSVASMIGVETTSFIAVIGAAGLAIGLTLKTADNKVVIVPNGSLSNGNITNYSRETTRRVDINLGIDYSSDIRKARDVLLKIAEDPRIHRDPAPAVFVTGLGDSAVNLSLRVWVATADFWPVTFEFTELAKERLSDAGIGIPFPQRVVHLVQAS